MPRFYENKLEKLIGCLAFIDVFPGTLVNLADRFLRI
jgi:hypothetical protein